MDIAENTKSAQLIAQLNREIEEEKIEILAQQKSMPYIKIDNQRINPDVLKTLDFDFAQSHKATPFAFKGQSLQIVTTNIDVDVSAIEQQSKLKIIPMLCSEVSFQNALRAYDSKFLQRKTIERTLVADESRRFLGRDMKELSDIEAGIMHMTTEAMLNNIQIASIKLGSSDIHIQPQEDNSFVVRYRIDGVMMSTIVLPGDVGMKLLTYLKYISHMKPNITTIPQDGRTSFEINGRSIDVRVSVIPTEKKESLVMRILDSKKGVRSLEELGFSPAQKAKIDSILNSKNGVIFLTGPTGSGKTTTLYSFLSELNAETKKVITLEDPVEYHLNGITQSQINPSAGFTFAAGLRSILRHDPDIIMVGEIRDQETALTTIESALTGHLVLSSLHTNSALASIFRLRKLGINKEDVSLSTRGIVSQRLVRKLCQYCKKEKPFQVNDHSHVSETIKFLKLVYEDAFLPKIVYEAQGCEKCNDIGYLGREIVSEIIIFDEKVRRMILEDATESSIVQELRQQQGFLTLSEDATYKYLMGITDDKEVVRVVGF